MPSMPTLPVLETAPWSHPAATDSGDREVTVGAPRRIGPDEITGVLGTGGMGVVDRAELQGQRVQARPDARTYRTRTFIGRHRSAVAGASLATVTPIAGSILTSVQAVNRFLVGGFEDDASRAARGGADIAATPAAAGPSRRRRDAEQPRPGTSGTGTLRGSRDPGAPGCRDLGAPRGQGGRRRPRGPRPDEPGPECARAGPHGRGDSAVRAGHAGPPGDARALASADALQGRVQVARTRALLGNPAGASREADASLAAAAVNPNIPRAVLAEADLDRFAARLEGR